MTPTRKDIRRLDQDELDTLIRAFDGIQKLDPKDPDSFFCIAGYHGEPFRGAGWGNSSWWGGYCNHGNVLFPTWHRAYLYRLEKALQKIKGCAGVTIPYWNEIDDLTLTQGLPAIFLQKDYTFKDGQTSIDGKSSIPNPLYSYKFQAAIFDNLSSFPDADYSKPQNYETVRYPFSGLVGSGDIDTTMAHNRVMNDLGSSKTNEYLNDNVRMWLNSPIFKDDRGQVHHAGLKMKYLTSLGAKNYTIFSNEASAMQWNEDGFSTDPDFKAVVPIESPHDGMHLAIGGYEVPGGDVNTVPGANGDMGENETAAFDPIFYFHHCFIDLIFWKWQLDHGKTKELDIIPRYPGTNSVDSQGPTPGVAGGSWLTMDSPLEPFVKRVPSAPGRDGRLPPVQQSVPMTSKVRDVFRKSFILTTSRTWSTSKNSVTPTKSLKTLNLRQPSRRRTSGSRA